MKLSEWMQLSREERTAHIDLSTPCQPDGSWHRNKHVLLDFHELENDYDNWMTSRVHRCHLCECGSRKGNCNNPQHFYFGTASENHLDTDPEWRKRRSAAAGAASKGNSWSSTAEARKRFLTDEPEGSSRELAEVYGVSHATIQRWKLMQHKFT